MNHADSSHRDWTLISSHGAVFVFLAANPSSTIRVIAGSVGITERQVARIIKDLSDAKLIELRRSGRRNVYDVNPEAHFRHPVLAHVRLDRLIESVVPELVRSPEIHGRPAPGAADS